jgi:hypothetical protein
MTGHDLVARRLKQGLLAFGTIAAILLLAEHRAHVLPYLPWLLLAVCPLMHIFMHQGDHRNHAGPSSAGRVPEGDDHE